LRCEFFDGDKRQDNLGGGVPHRRRDGNPGYYDGVKMATMVAHTMELAEEYLAAWRRKISKE
jgi:hypothetical protein